MLSSPHSVDALLTPLRRCSAHSVDALPHSVDALLTPLRRCSAHSLDPLLTPLRPRFPPLRRCSPHPTPSMLSPTPSMLSYIAACVILGEGGINYVLYCFTSVHGFGATTRLQTPVVETEDLMEEARQTVTCEARILKSLLLQ